MRHRAYRGLVAVIISLAALGAGRAGAQLSSVPPPSFAVAAQRGTQELLGSGDHSPVSWSYATGLWGGHVPANWWQSALAVMTIVRYAERTGSAAPVYQRVLARVYARNIRKPHSTAPRDFANQFMDDTGWWGLAWLEAARYELYNRVDWHDAARFLAVAEFDARYIASQPRPCGGIEWGIGFPPDTISNAEFIALTAGLAVLRDAPGPLYSPGRAAAWLSDARAALTWLEGSGLINLRTGSVYDGLNSGCHVIGGAMTYTEGETAEALLRVGMALGDPIYADRAAAFLRYSTTQASELVTTNGILQERCEAVPGKCSRQRFRRDIPAYKGLLIDAMSDWATQTGSTAFDSFLNTQATAVVDNAIRGPGNDLAHCTRPRTCQFAFHWNGEPDPAPLGITLGGQESALDALTAVLPARGTQRDR